MKRKKVGVLASAIATTAVCASMVVGSTFALFTDEDTVNVAVTAGKVDIAATFGDIITGTTFTDFTNDVPAADGSVAFENGGFAKITGNTLELEQVSAGDKVSFNINIDNASTINVKYRWTYQVEDGYLLADNLDVAIGAVTMDTDEGKYKSYRAVWDNLDAAGEGYEAVIPVTVTIPNHSDSVLDNLYQGLNTKISFAVEAVQGNGAVVDANAQAEVTYLPNYSDIKEAYLNGTVTAVTNAETLQAAVNEGGNIVLANNLTLEKRITLDNSKDFNLDFGGHTVYSLQSGQGVFRHTSSYTGSGTAVTFSNGAIVSASTAFWGYGQNTVFTFRDMNVMSYSATEAIYMKNGATAVIESGTYAVDCVFNPRTNANGKYAVNYLLNTEAKAMTPSNPAMFYDHFEYRSEEHGVVVVMPDDTVVSGVTKDGATVTGYANYFLLNLQDKNIENGINESYIVVKGGTFKNFNPGNNLAEEPRVNFVAENHTVVYKQDDSGVYWFTVVAKEVVTDEYLRENQLTEEDPWDTQA